MKHYNPFTMFGSWIGIVIGGGTGFVLQTYYKLFTYYCIDRNSIIWLTQNCPELNYGVPIISGMFCGFLLGWGIHSLIRSLRR